MAAALRITATPGGGSSSDDAPDIPPDFEWGDDPMIDVVE